jgi:hypothetical protein
MESFEHFITLSIPEFSEITSLICYGRLRIKNRSICVESPELGEIRVPLKTQNEWSILWGMLPHEKVFQITAEFQETNNKIVGIRKVNIFLNVLLLRHVAEASLRFIEETKYLQYFEPFVVFTKFLTRLYFFSRYEFRVSPMVRHGNWMSRTSVKRRYLEIFDEVVYYWPARLLYKKTEIPDLVLEHYYQMGTYVFNADGDYEIRYLCQHLQEFEASTLPSIVVCPHQCIESWRYYAKKFDLRHKTIPHISAVPNFDYDAEASNLSLLIVNAEVIQELPRYDWNRLILHMVPLSLLHAVQWNTYKYLYYVTHQLSASNLDYSFLPYFVRLNRFSEVTQMAWIHFIQQALLLKEPTRTSEWCTRLKPELAVHGFINSLKINPARCFQDMFTSPTIHPSGLQSYLEDRQMTSNPFCSDIIDEECHICFESPLDTVMKCGHAICYNCCLRNLDETRRSCPYCKASLESGYDMCLLNAESGVADIDVIKYGWKNVTAVEIIKQDFRISAGTIVMIDAKLKDMKIFLDMIRSDDLPVWHLRGRDHDKQKTVHNFRKRGYGVLFAEPFAPYLEGVAMPWVRNVVVYLPCAPLTRFFPILSPKVRYTAVGYEKNDQEVMSSLQLYSQFQDEK